MNRRLLKIGLHLHFTALAIAILNALFHAGTGYHLEENMALGIKLLTVASGLILFFFFLKSNQKIKRYFSVYPILGVLVLLGLIFRGVFWALVLSVILFPLIPDTKQYEENGIIITTPFQGLLAPCCTYQIKERHLLFLEKDYEKWEVEGIINFETIQITSNEKEIEITYTTAFEDGIIHKKKFIKD